MFSSLLRRIIKFFTKTFVRYRIEQKVEAIKDYLSERPLIAIVVLVFAVFSALPILIFLMFAFGSMVFTFFGFLILEGKDFLYYTTYYSFIIHDQMKTWKQKQLTSSSSMKLISARSVCTVKIAKTCNLMYRMRIIESICNQYIIN